MQKLWKWAFNLYFPTTSKEQIMDPITTAILAAISAGAISGVTKVGEQVLIDAYGKLKEMVKTKFGPGSKLVAALNELEANPKSAARKEVLKEEVAASKADQDNELLQAAQTLIKSIKALPGGTQIIQTAIGDQNIQIAGDGNIVNVSTPNSQR
jgi:hypothetical protein